MTIDRRFDPDCFAAEALPAILEGDVHGFTRWAEQHVTSAQAMHQLLLTLAHTAAVLTRQAAAGPGPWPGTWVMERQGGGGLGNGPEAQALRMVVAAMNGDGPGLTGMVTAVVTGDGDYSAAVVAYLLFMMSRLADDLTGP